MASKMASRVWRKLRLKKGQARLLRIVGYPLFGLLVFLVSLYLSLPLDRIKARIERELSLDNGPGAAPAGTWGIGSGLDVTIGELDLKFLPLGALATDITVRGRPKEGAPPATAEDQKKFKPTLIESLRAKVSLWSLLTGARAAALSIEALGGTLEGEGGLYSDHVALHTTGDKLTLQRAPILAQLLPLPLGGVLGTQIDVSVPLKKQDKPSAVRRAGILIDLPKATGSIDLHIEQGTLGDGKAKLVVPGDPFMSQGLTFPKLSLGTVTGHVVFDRGRATLSEVNGQSSDASISVEGYLELKDPMQISELHLYLRFKPSAALIKREPTMEILSNAMALGKRADGSLGFAITGTFANPRSRPAREPPEGVTLRSATLSAVRADAVPAISAAQPIAGGAFPGVTPPPAGRIVDPGTPMTPPPPPLPAESPTMVSVPTPMVPPPPPQAEPTQAIQGQPTSTALGPTSTVPQTGVPSAGGDPGTHGSAPPAEPSKQEVMQKKEDDKPPEKPAPQPEKLPVENPTET